MHSFTLRFSIKLVIMLVLLEMETMRVHGEANGIQAYYVQAMPGCEKGRRLTNDHFIASFSTGSSLIRCGMKCLSHGNCKSFNLYNGTYQKCYLFSDTAEDCSELELHDSWMYLRLRDDEKAAEVDTGIASTANPLPGPPCEERILCNRFFCSAWEEALAYNAGGEVTGNVACFLLAVSNGASVRVLLTQLENGFVHTLTPTESIIDLESHTGFFYFGPKYIANNVNEAADRWSKMYLGLSTDGFYQRSIYSLAHALLSTFPREIFVGKFFIRYADCSFRSNDIPTGIGKRKRKKRNETPPVVKPDTDGVDDLASAVSYGAAITTSIKQNKSVYSYKVGWSIAVSQLEKLGVFKSKGDSFEDSPSLEVEVPLSRNLKILVTDGRVNSLKENVSTGRTEQAKEETNITQSQYVDQCWRPVYKVAYGDKEDHMYDSTSLTTALQSGASMRFLFLSGNQIVYSAGIPKVHCIKMNCLAELEDHPKFDETAPFEFIVNQGDPFAWYSSQLRGSVLHSNHLNEQSSTSWTSEEGAATFWFADDREHMQVFNANKKKTHLNAIDSVFGRAYPLRLMIVDAASNTSDYFDIEELVQQGGTTSFELRTPGISSRKTGGGGGGLYCRKVPVIITVVVVRVSGTLPAVVEQQTFDWADRTECGTADAVPFSQLVVFAPRYYTAS